MKERKKELLKEWSMRGWELGREGYVELIECKGANKYDLI